MAQWIVHLSHTWLVPGSKHDWCKNPTVFFMIASFAKQKKKERKDITGTNCLKGDNGELLVSEEQVSGRWREYFEKLLNEENEWNDDLSAEYVEGPADMISKEEVRQAIQDLKVRKAAGPSGVTAEMIKAAGKQAVDWLTSICNRIVKEEQFQRAGLVNSREWTSAHI